MNPADEIRALTCHCGRIACRHHPDIPAGYVTARPARKTDEEADK